MIEQKCFVMAVYLPPGKSEERESIVSLGLRRYNVSALFMCAAKMKKGEKESDGTDKLSA